jgi:putative DNA primase/helicase
MRHNFALTEAEALPLFREWNLTCKPPWSEAGLLAKLRGGAKYAKGKFGDRRQVDVLTQVMALLDAYAQGGQDKTRLPELTAKINQIIATGIPQATWAVINHEIKIATTLTAKALGIGKPNALKAAGEARVAANPGGVIDPEYYDKQALAVLDPTRDEAGIPLLARWGEDFWKFNGAYYAPVSSEHIDVASRKWLGGKLDTKGDEVKACSHHVDEIRKALIGQITVTGGVAPAWRSDEPFPANEAICFANGVLRLTPRTWLPGPRRDLFSLSSTSFGFDPDAPTPARWLAFLNQIWPNDPEAISTLQEIFGLMLTTDTSFQKIFMVIGPRRSGKGTIARVLTELVGQTGVCHPTLGGLGQHFGLQGLIGKQLAVISDARLSAKSDVSQATEALLRISGEDGISIPRKNREDVALKLNVRFLLLTNELPYLYDSAGALAARFVILQMAHSFLGQETLDLTRRLLTELPGIALWALEGLERLYSRGRLVQPASGKQAMVELEEITSPIKAFVEDKCVIGPGISCAATEIYQAWCEWCAQSGRKETGTVQILGRNLKAAFPSVTSVRVGEGGQRRFGGVRVR